MHCCSHARTHGHGHAHALTDDPRFADDEFTQAALEERRIRAAHAHAASGVLAIGLLGIGGLVAAALCRRR